MGFFNKVSGFFNKLLFVDSSKNKEPNARYVVLTGHYKLALDKIDYEGLSREIKSSDKLYGFQESLGEEYKQKYRDFAEAVVARELYSGRLNKVAIPQLTEYVTEIINESFRLKNENANDSLEEKTLSEGFSLKNLARENARKYYSGEGGNSFFSSNGSYRNFKVKYSK